MQVTRSLFLSWCNKLRDCSDLDLANQYFCHAIAECSQSVASIIFLLDQEKKHLQPCAYWSRFNSNLPFEQTLDLNFYLNHDIANAEDLNDPLAFALYSGKKCIISDCSSFNDVTTQLIDKLCNNQSKQVIILPLVAPTEQMIGVVLTVHTEDTLKALSKEQDDTDVDINLLCNYGAAVLHSCIQTVKIDSLVNAFQEDFKRLQDEQSLRENPENNWDIIGNSKEIKTVIKLIKKTSLSNSTVLITGETGTGKELVAAAIHETSRRADKPFLKINCSAMPENLFESELFGYIKGAFTGADKSSSGLLRSADGGTLLLDEIGDMSLSLQTKLLRFLQDRLVRPVGDVNSYPVNIRIIASTNCDLEKAIDSGEFRRDLYHRLAVFTIALPPLRHRIEDIYLLAEHFTKHFATQYQRYQLRLAPESLQLLYSYTYLGNVRELIALIERAVLMTDANTKLLEPSHFKQQENKVSSLPILLSRYEAEIIKQIYRECQGNVAQVASILGIPRRTLAYKLQKDSLMNKNTRMNQSNTLEMS